MEPRGAPVRLGRERRAAARVAGGRGAAARSRHGAGTAGSGAGAPWRHWTRSSSGPSCSGCRRTRAAPGRRRCVGAAASAARAALAATPETEQVGAGGRRYRLPPIHPHLPASPLSTLAPRLLRGSGRSGGLFALVASAPARAHARPSRQTAGSDTLSGLSVLFSEAGLRGLGMPAGRGGSLLLCSPGRPEPGPGRPA